MDPVQTTAHPGAGPSKWTAGTSWSRSRTSARIAEGTAGLGYHLGQGADGDLDTHHVSEELGHAVIRQVLVHRQVDGQGADSGAITGGAVASRGGGALVRTHRHNGDAPCGAR